MNPRTVFTRIDEEKCIGCGQCVQVCPSDTIELVEKKARVTGEKSLGCGHCAAVCPTGAAQVTCLDPEMTRFSSFDLNPAWVEFGKASPAELARLMGSRRSCRNFKPTPVSSDILEDLIKFAALAPSGTNSQDWTFTCLTDREKVLNFAGHIKSFFEDLNKKAQNPWLRKGLSLVGQRELEKYYQEYYESVQEAMTQMETLGRDRLFHGATACILVGSGPDASCPKEDALLATGNILLAAHTLGLGSCLIGFAVAAMKSDRSIQTRMHIPAREKIHAVIALGYPDERYERISGRKKPVIRFC